MVERVLLLRTHATADGAAGRCQGALPAGALPAAQRNAAIRYHSELPDHRVPLICDRRQVSQVLTNILKNAAEAIEGRVAKPGVALPPGEISLSLKG
jgi:signal transduction histidine kinase